VSEQRLSGKFPTAERLGVISNHRPRNSHIFERARNDLYIEPSWCSERLFAIEQFPGVIWDPCRGTGTIITSARATGLEACGTDISEGCDFLLIKPVCDPPVFSIVTNPPYANAQEIVEHALALGALKVAFLFPTARVHAANWLEQLPVAHQHFLQPRPSVPPIHAKKKGGGRVDFSWVVLDRRHRGPPTWGWLHRDRASSRS
jgi:hypothetical protein